MPHQEDQPDYRPPEEKEAWEARDPIKRFEEYLIGSGLLDQAKKDAKRRECYRDWRGLLESIW
jgi:TPP-dependent pyruvate/acetoin dehydrogenase alpha subunit